MAKKQKQVSSSVTQSKLYGRSTGPLVLDPVVGDKVKAKVYAARRNNNPSKYHNI